MELEDEINQKMKDFFAKTCITKFIFKNIDSTEFLKMRKKSPIGIWNIKSVELGYFIDYEDRVIIGLLNKHNDEIYQIIIDFLTEHAEKVEK